MSRVLLVVLDGLGDGPDGPGNAVRTARMPCYRELIATYPSTLLEAKGAAVGLPAGAMGGSEVGHLTMGAGRIVWQPYEAINQAISSGRLEQQLAEKNVFTSRRPLHLIGMISDEGVHAHIEHLLAVITMARTHDIPTYVHVILDGRDVPPQSAATYLKQIAEQCQKTGAVLASGIGRYYAMDRDQNFDRTEVAYRLLTAGVGEKYNDYTHYLAAAYAKDPNDYYAPAAVFPGFTPITQDSTVIFTNFRSDRAKQLTAAFIDPAFTAFPRDWYCTDNHFIAFGPYTADLAPVLFPPEDVKNYLGSYLAQHGKTQLRIAETEKYAHVTFFFNAQIEEPDAGEERILIPSPKVKSYAEQPEMAAREVTEKLIATLATTQPDFALVNFANPDLVGHSSDLTATITACETVDQCLAQIMPIAQKNGYAVIVTADHGNADQMLYPDGSICPAHSLNPVRCIIVSEQYKNAKLQNGCGLASITPTVCVLMGLPVPHEMTANSLLQ